MLLYGQAGWRRAERGIITFPHGQARNMKAFQARVGLQQAYRLQVNRRRRDDELLCLFRPSAPGGLDDRFFGGPVFKE